jgi:hypothetical protein
LGLLCLGMAVFRALCGSIARLTEERLPWRFPPTIPLYDFLKTEYTRASSWSSLARMLQARTNDGELFVALSAYEILHQMRMTVWEPRPARVEDYVESVSRRVEQMTGKRPAMPT